MIGTTVGKYRIVGLLGRGATGIVYKAVDDTLHREVAIKILNPHLAAPDLMKRFHAEATTLAKLSHPEIATIHELLRNETDLLMVMELVRGETLEALSGRAGAMSPDVAGHLLDGILSALAHAHSAGVVHRDLKPANVMVTQFGGVKIMDFGIARVRGTERMTIDGCTVGTPAYMAPEQVLGEETDGRADLYAVGVIFYRLLTGRLPFDADTPLVMLQKQIVETPPPLHRFREELPDWCEPIVQRALAKSPIDRFQTAEEFREMVGRAIGLAPSIDLAKALAIAPDCVPASGPEALLLKTAAISRTEAKLAGESVVHTATLGQDDTLEARTSPERHNALDSKVHSLAGVLFSRAKDFTRTPKGAAVLGVVAAVGVGAYLATAGPTTATGAGAVPGTRPGERLASPNASSAAGSSRRPSEHAVTYPPPVDIASGARTITEAPALAFDAKILARDGRPQHQENGRLTLARGHVSVTPYSTPDEPLFAVPYGDITAIHYTRQPAWKPPQKLSRVIRLSDDVLDTLPIPERHEISLHAGTEDRFVLLRVEERVVNKLLSALKQRTGRTPARAVDR